MEYKKEFKVSEIFLGLKPGPNTHKEILEMVNQRRPYCPDDFKKHHFIENIAHNPAEAAMYKARNEFFIKGY